MTIGNYIRAKFSRFQFTVSDEELEAMLVDLELTPETEYSTELSDKVKKVMIIVIPELLIAPDISQGDYSIKYKVDGIKAYYSILCKELGLPDIYNSIQDAIVGREDIW